MIDTADMYGPYTNEELVGKAIAGRRDRVFLATKFGVVRDSDNPHSRGVDGSPDYVRRSVEGSLKRLQTDVIDLYQLHWPERITNYFGRLGYKHRDGEDGIAISETVAALKALVEAGKIRHWGLSNETPWGTMTFLREAEKIGLAPPVSIQNPYSLLNRSFEVGLAEIAHREHVGLLAYSPLAFGMLTGKYRNNQWPKGARLTEVKQFSRYTNEQASAATDAYCQLAEERGLSPTQLALQFVTTRPFVTSNIIGATSLSQLEENLKSVDLPWDRDLEKALEAIHTRFPYPAP